MSMPSDSDNPDADYDPRYLSGIVLFNRGEYFDAHEVWEDVWHECPSADRRFYQSLIQAAVALYHGGNGNRPGATRLSESGKKYMAPYRPRYRGLDVDAFWRQVFDALAPLLHGTGSPSPAPRIALDPEPDTWPQASGNSHE
jgi:predicted metal-dependent hydrolase